MELKRSSIDRLVPHEQYREDHALEVMEWFKRDGFQLRPIAIYKLDEHGYPNYALILDGHHRTEAARRLGLRYMMANEVNYFDKRIRVESWNDGSEVSKEEIIRLALNKVKLRPKTTKHVFLVNGISLPFQDNDHIEPKIYTDLETLK